MDSTHLRDWIQIAVGLVALAGVVGAGAALLRDRGRKILATAVLEEIRDQVKPNGGGSLADAINRTEACVHEMSGRLDILQAGYRFALRAGDAIWECNATGECVYANAQLCELFGLPLNDMLGWKWLVAIDGPQERTRVADVWNRSVKDGIPYQVEYRVHNNRTGEIFQGEARGFPVPAGDGKTLWYFGTFTRLAPVRYFGKTEVDATTSELLERRSKVQA